MRINLILIFLLSLGAFAFGGMKMFDNNRLYLSDIDEERIYQEAAVVEEEAEDDDDPMKRVINFAELQKINAGVTRWIYVPDTKIDGPIVQEQVVGQYKYNWLGIDGKKNGSGSFMAPAAPNDKETGLMQEDDHLIVLGHRMNTYNGEWKFSHIPTRWASAEGAEAYPYVYIYYEDRVEKYRVWAGAHDSYKRSTYNENHNPEYLTPYFTGDDDYGAMLNHVEGKAKFTYGEAPTKYQKTMMMSTCNNAQVNGGRYHITNVLVETYEYDTGITTVH